MLVSEGEIISLGAVDARFVNDRGQVAGTVLNLDDPANPSVNPFVWDRGMRTDMGPIPDWEGRNSRIVDFNDRGAVLGIGLGPESFEVGFVWRSGRIEPVGDPRAFGGSGVVDINDHGWVVGADFTSYWVYVAGPLAGACVAVGMAFVLRGRGGGKAGSGAAQGALFTETQDPEKP